MADITGRVYGTTSNNGSNIFYGTRTYGDNANSNVTISSSSIANDGYTSSAGAQNFTATFTEIDIQNFVSTDVTALNGLVSNFTGPVTVGGVDTFTFDVTPSGQGLVSVSVASGVANDSAGNPNNASNVYTFTYDSVQPTVALTSGTVSYDGYTNVNVENFTATFSESVTGFVLSDIIVTNAAKSNFTAVSGSVYTFDVSPTSQGLVTVSINAGVAQDGAGNTNTAASQYKYTYDSDPPSATTVITNPAISNDGYTYLTPESFQVTFSENVTGFMLSDIIVTNAAKSNFTVVSGSVYTFDLTPTGQGLVTVNVNANVAFDAASNGNLAAPEFRFTFDSVQPTVVLTSGTVANNGLTNASVANFTATFSESVTGFVLSDITVTNAVKSNFAGSGTTYTFDVTPTGQGLVTVNINAGVASDNAGNTNTAATQYQYTYDSVQPTVAITSSNVTNGGNTLDSVVHMIVTFSESVTGFTLSDITVSSGIKSNFAGSGTTYTFDLTLTVGAVVTVDIAAGVAQDLLLNYNIAAPQFSFTFLNTISGTISGTRSGIEYWNNEITFVSNIIIPNNTTVVIDVNAIIFANGFTLVVEDGGYLDTQNKRLPHSSSLGSVLVIV
jgi:hypothetical protein